MVYFFAFLSLMCIICNAYGIQQPNHWNLESGIYLAIAYVCYAINKIKKAKDVD